MTDCKHPAYKSVMIHASAVEYRGKALVFLGPSETGKSTISQLLAGTLDNARVLADDKVCLDAVGEGDWMVSDAWPRLRKMSETQLSPIPHYAPLGAIFRLYQAPWPHLESVDMFDTCLYLVKAFSEFDRRQANSFKENRECFTSLAAMARTTPGYEFYFNRSLQAADTIRQETSFVYIGSTK